jgi:chaperonin GroES
MKLKPRHNHVALKQENLNEQKIGNIIIPDSGKERPRIGIVVAIGIGTYTISGDLIPTQVAVGDKVAYPSMGGHVMAVGDEEFVIIKDPDILTIIED